MKMMKYIIHPQLHRLLKADTGDWIASSKMCIEKSIIPKRKWFQFLRKIEYNDCEVTDIVVIGKTIEKAIEKFENARMLKNEEII